MKVPITEVEKLRFMLAFERLERAKEHVAITNAAHNDRAAEFSAEVAKLNATYGADGKFTVTDIEGDFALLAPVAEAAPTVTTA